MKKSNLTYKELAIPYFKEVFQDLEEILKEHKIHSYLVGASAIAVQFLKKGIKPARGTMDIDFAIMIDSKEKYDSITAAVVKKGYNKVRAPWTFYHPKYNIVLDLLPFGEIEQEFTQNFNERETALHILGFSEVLEDADEIQISGRTINVPSLPGIVIKS